MKPQLRIHLSHMGDKWKDVWGAMGEPEYGIGGA